jgi:hypothetical protein
MKAKLNKVRVHRITVDEKLSPNLCRFTVCSLRDGKWQFKDREDEWLEEREKLVNPRSYHRTLRVKKAEAPAWESLEEGQVYLSGEFEAVGEPEPEKFRVNQGQRKFMRIDNLALIREGLRALYSDVMGRD